MTNVFVAGAWRSDFVYDGLGRRRITRDYAWQSGTWGSPTNEIHYIYDGNLVLQERNGSDTVQVTYTRGTDMRGTTQGAGGIGGLLARTDSNGSTFYHADGNGNVTSLTDANENVVARYLYDSFGKVLGQWGSLANANAYRFSSKEFHPNSGLVYYLYRFYDPNLQRWLNRDPLAAISMTKRVLVRRSFEIDQSLKAHGIGGIPFEAWAWVAPNLYQYEKNEPLAYLDPYGLFTVGVGVTIGIQWGPINIAISTGLTGDSQGNINGYWTVGGGSGLGAGIFAGVSVQASNAKCNNDLSGPFGYGSIGGGFGGAGSFDGFWGDSPDGPVFGGGATIGVGLGGGAAAGG